ncbi:helix-turn-helix transcriptional regulator [Leucobacter albus]|uniref:Helix-turn-helix transcriptional regulator n=1 Tax=Leucobacter albus TaxID=272210 RepID=A0ABW3TNS0_9MICO
MLVTQSAPLDSSSLGAPRDAPHDASLGAPLSAPHSAPLDTLLERIDVAVTRTNRVGLRAGRRLTTPAGANTLVYVVEGELRGEPATSCSTDPEREGAVVARGHVTGFPAGAALLTTGTSAFAFDALSDATLVVVTVELNEAGLRLRQLVPDPLTITDFARLDPAVSSLASNMGDLGTPEPVVPLVGGGEIVCRLMARTLLLGVLRAWVSAGCAPRGWAARVADPHLDPVITAIHSDPGRDWSVDALASLGTMSRSALSRRFRELLGASPGQYITGVRMEDAKRRLARGASVTQTSRELGYASDEGFSRAFRRHTGVPPSRWRVGAPNTRD